MSATLTVNGVVSGGSASGAHGVRSAVPLDYNIVVSTAKGGSAAGALGVSSCNSSCVVSIGATDTSGTGSYPVGASEGILKMAAGAKLVYQNASAVLTKFYDPTLMPSQANVRSAVSYGGSDFTGSCAVPNAHQVILGVSVDATVGDVTIPDASIVLSGETFGSSLSQTGALNATGIGHVIGG